MKLKDIKAGEVYAIRQPNSTYRYIGNEYVYTYGGGVDSYADKDKPEAWRTAIVLDADARIPHTDKAGIAVAFSNRAFLPRRGIMTPDDIARTQWNYAVILPSVFQQPWKMWVTDIVPIIKAQKDAEKKRQAIYKKQEKERLAAAKKNEAARKKRIKEAAEAEKKRLADLKKNNPELAKRMAQEAKDTKDGVKARQRNETRLRTILANFGINDSDGWRGVNTKTRYSNESGKNVLTTYVRHLDVYDVLTLTGGLEEPPAKTAAKKATTPKKKEAKTNG